MHKATETQPKPKHNKNNRLTAQKEGPTGDLQHGHQQARDLRQQRGAKKGGADVPTGHTASPPLLTPPTPPSPILTSRSHNGSTSLAGRGGGEGRGEGLKVWSGSWGWGWGWGGVAHSSIAMHKDRIKLECFNM